MSSAWIFSFPQSSSLSATLRISFDKVVSESGGDMPWNNLPFSGAVRFLWGEKDVWAAPALGQTIAELTSNFETVVIGNAGHAPWFDDLDAVVASIEGALAAK